jgi:tetratricopeptide (TPR) repeat protein
MTALFAHEDDEVRAIATAAILRFDDETFRARFHWLLWLVHRGPHERVHLEAALESLPCDPWLLFARAVDRRSRGDREGAIEDYDRALAFHPHFERALVNRGAAHLSAGSLDLAEADLTAALGLDPRDTVALLNRGAVRQEAGDLAGAIDDCNRILAIDPESVDAFVNRGNARRRGGDLRGAIVDFTSALHLDRRYVKAWSARSEARWQLGDRGPSIADLEAALVVAGPEGSGRGILENLLRERRETLAREGE